MGVQSGDGRFVMLTAVEVLEEAQQHIKFFKNKKTSEHLHPHLNTNQVAHKET